MSVRRLLLPVCLSAAACSGGDDATTGRDATATGTGRLAANIRTLASDAFGGRAPGSAGERLTTDFLREKFSGLGLEPGNGESYLQPVPLVAITADENVTLEIAGDAGKLLLHYRDDMMVWTKRVSESVAITDSELVFAGYGIVAPEYAWNDFDGIDAAGKTLVVLVNDPGFATQDPALFRGNVMTYYGRWRYKLEEAARHGAAGVIIVHENAAAGYGWDVIRGSWAGEQFDLVTSDGNASRAAFEAWITQDAAKALFTAAGMDYESARDAASRRGFRAQRMPLEASVALQNRIRRVDSNNVVAWLPGKTYPDETVIYTAHWDHLGMRPTADGPQIFNGAVDNAAGTAALIELAHAFTERPEPPQRSIVFAAVTAEESGLLGSRYYAENPPFPLEKTVAVINMDSPNVFGRTRDVTVIGYGNSELDDYLARAAERQGRVLVREPTPEKGFFYRSDHFNFAKLGVPALYAEGGIDFVDGGTDRGRRISRDYIANRYHKPADEFDPNWDLSGQLDDIALYFDVGHALANERSWPNWREGNEFRALRDASAAARDP